MVHNIAWAAGILEGEGCFSIHKRKDRANTTNCAIHCEMTDEDTILKLQEVLGVGNVNYRKPRPNKRPSWILSIQKQEEIFITLIRLGPYLMGRRKQQAKKLYDYLEDKICGPI